MVRPNYFDEPIAAIYDADCAEMFMPQVLDPTVAFLAELAGDGRALELAIGTGRVALPLRRRGVQVQGIDLSPAMVARLRAKDGADAIDVTMGDIVTTRVDGEFRLVYLVFNTISNLTTQDDQVACFVNAAAHLEPGGCFVIELGVPDLQRLAPGDRFRAFQVEPTRLGFDEYDVLAQGMISHHYWVVDGELRTISQPFRYAWPAELDLMARIAGLELRERWSTWTREPFTALSRSHVSVWQKPR